MAVGKSNKSKDQEHSFKCKGDERDAVELKFRMSK